MDPSLPRIQLDQHERDRFANWLEAEAASDEELARQMEQFGHLGPLMKKYRTEALAARVIALKLRSIESVTIGAAPEAA